VTFTDLTRSLDVIGHELTHGVTQFTAGLEYHKEPGALNESMSDVFGSLVKQWSLQQSVEQADWLIGADVFTPGTDMDALRSMKAPGTAFEGDPQPDHMDRFVHLPDTEEGDNGGVHYNSGIPNKAFYLTAKAIGGFAWERPGVIWYESLKASTETTQFQAFADTTYSKAGELFLAGGPEQSAVVDAWRQVGIRISGLPAGTAAIRARSLSPSPSGSTNGCGDGAADLASLTARIEGLSKQVAGLRGKK
jgi:Zn-dependent metalloprotease